jgi:hypothetical protein
MKKILALIFCIMLLIPALAYAQEFSANVWASWAQVSTVVVTWTFPYRSRSIEVQNGDPSHDVCIGFNSNIPTTACLSTGNNTLFKVARGQNFFLHNIAQSAVSFIATDATYASPVGVIIVY